MSFFSIKNNVLLYVALAAFIILRIPSLFEPHWYADEGIYAAITYAIESGRMLYVDIWDNKPMLIYWLYGLGEPTNRLLVVRSINFLAGILSIVGIHLILNQFKLGKKSIAAGLAVALYLLATPLIEGNIANAENFFLPLTIFAYLAVIKKYPHYYVAGLLLGIGFMLKFHPLFDFVAIAVWMFFIEHKKRTIFYMGMFFLLPNLLQYVYWYFNGNLIPALQTIFLNNFSYTGSYSTGLHSIQFRTSVLVLAAGLLTYAKLYDYIGKKRFLIALMLLFQSYGMLFGGRQYLHYILQIVPGITIVTALFAQKIFTDKETRVKFALYYILLVFALLKSFTFSEGNIGFHSVSKYYASFYNYAVGSTPYFLYPTEETLQNMRTALARYNKQSIFIYTNNPWIYDVLEIVPPAIITAGYHRTFIADGVFMDSLVAAKTDLIVLDVNADNDDRLNQYVWQEYAFSEKVDNYEIWVRMSN